MALLVLLSTVSFTVEKHYCGDALIDASVFSEVEKCASEAYEIELEKITKKPCCKDVVDVIEGQDELQKTSFDDLDQQLFLTAYFKSYKNLFEGLPNHVIPHKDYSPPNLVFDIQLLDAVFLI
ncbi:HYC_CC_PP family protein [Ichthyenterobacterium magnum]